MENLRMGNDIAIAMMKLMRNCAKAQVAHIEQAIKELEEMKDDE